MTAAWAWRRSPLPWLGAILALYLLSPIGAFAGRLATTHRTAAPGTGSALLVSLETATIATAVIAVLGVPLAYVLAQGRSRGSAVIGVAVQLPIALPPLISGVMLLYVVGPQTAIGRLFGGHLTDTRAGIVLAQIFVAAPFLIVAARSAFATVDPALNDVAATLGHGGLARFFRVALPVATPGIAAGLLLSWLRAFGEFGATVILAYHPYSLPVFTYVQFGSTGLAATLLPTAAALGAALVVLLGAVAAARWGQQLAVPQRRPRPARHVTGGGTDPGQPRPLAFDLRAHAGSFVVAGSGSTRRTLAVIGESGAGKTLMLRALAGLVPADTISAELGDRNLASLPPQHRRIGYLPQESSLLPHLPVRDQVGFGTHADDELVAHWLERLELGAVADRRPAELSLGQQRRVALARALAGDPELLLLDEPLTGLDTPGRHRLRRMLREVLTEAAITTVIVTHDPADLAMLADDVAVLVGGQTAQRGPVADLYRRPATPQVAQLLGIRNALEMTVGRSGTVTTPDGFTLPADTAGLEIGTKVVAVVNPRTVGLGRGTGRPVTVTDVAEFPDHLLIEVRAGETTELVLQAGVPDARRKPVRRGDQANLTVPASAVTVSPIAVPPS
ncbi:MAG TPA: ATP-binding cassette domain-containing protein [Mycobacteriales bacterium]|nr:ATP-binding cassette domain-containing protein [Mycobacteriales bacterium]